MIDTVSLDFNFENFFNGFAINNLDVLNTSYMIIPYRLGMVEMVC
jgi:hypothetical protein